VTSDLRRLERRTLRVLVCAQVLGGVGLFVGLAVIALVVRDLSGSAALSGLAPAIAVAASALAALPLSALTGRAGRRWGLAAGYGAGATGAAIVVAAAQVGSFALLCVGVAFFGVGNTSNLLARYAGVDLAPPQRRARAMSTVLLATAAGAILGPNLAASAEGLPVAPFAGAYLVSIAAYLLAAGVLLVALRPDPLLVARRLATQEAADGAPPVADVGTGTTLPGAAAIGVSAMVLVNLTMVGVMTMTPVHLTQEGHGLTLVGLVISVHVAGMFLPSPLTGRLSDRFGPLAVIAGGGVVLVAAGAVGAAGAGSPLVVGVALALLGVAWNLGLLGGSALLTDATPIAHRTRVQGRADLVMGGAGALGSVASAPVLALGGFVALGAAAVVLALVLLAVAVRPLMRSVPVRA